MLDAIKAVALALDLCERRPSGGPKATGKLAKTDRLDAAILARMGALLELEARQPEAWSCSN